MVEVGLDLTLALVGLVGTSITALVWTLKRSFKFAEDMKRSLENHFTTENKILTQLNNNLISMNNILGLWETRWNEVLRPGFKQIDRIEIDIEKK